MSLTILNVAYPLAPVGPDAVGGAEQVLTSLDAALVRAGHNSIVIAAENSIAAGMHFPLPKWEGRLTCEVQKAAQMAVREAIHNVLKAYPVDVVHLHGIDFPEYLPDPGIPVLATLHLPPSWYPREIFQLTRPDTYFNCVSAAQRCACPNSPLIIGEVPNGVEVLARARRKGRFAVSLGRICPEKGFHLAMDAAVQAGIPFVLAGQVFGYRMHEEYFAREIAPRSSSKRRFIGPIGRERKTRLLSGARCLLAPCLAPETSSLVALEALASGTPVIAFPSGALPEIVEHERTGFLVNDVSEMAAAIHAAGKLDPATCLQAARDRFSLERMIQQYFALYDRLAGRAKPGRAGCPQHAAEPSILITELTTTRSLLALESEWRELWQASPSATPFQSPAWLIPWWGTFGSTGEKSLFVLLARRGPRLIGLAPFYIETVGEKRTLRFIGAGNTDYLDVLVAPDCAEAATNAILDYLQTHSARWDICDLQNLPPGSPLCNGETSQDTCPVLTLPSSKEELRSVVPRRMLDNLRYYRRRAEKSGSLRLELLDRNCSSAELDKFLDTFFYLHQSRWSSQGQSGVLVSTEVQQFHRHAAQALLRDRLLRLYVLHLGERPLAALYALAARRRFYYYLSGFDPEFSALSPGTLIVGAAMERAIDEGVGEFDFLRGGESYKYHWGAQDRPIFHRQIFSGAALSAATV